jgi:prophage regulatory protein
MIQTNRIILYKDLPTEARFCRVHLNRMIKRGEFPRPVRISANRIGWREADIDEFLANRPTAEPRLQGPHTEEAKAKMRAAWARRKAARS